MFDCFLKKILITVILTLKNDQILNLLLFNIFDLKMNHKIHDFMNGLG